MPRKPRKYSESGYMHVIVRGNAKQIIFNEDADYDFYISTLESFTRQSPVTICAYCLMSNHVHLLVMAPGNSISNYMKQVGISYTYYFNKKYDRCGHLFQDRFFSDVIESDLHFMEVYRYILQNPDKAGISSHASYKWCSYRLFSDPDSFIDSEMATSLFTDKEGLDEYLKTEGIDPFPRHMDDNEAYDFACRLLCVKNLSEIIKCNKYERDAALRELKAHGIPIRQIARLTGLGRSIVQRA